MSGDRPRRRDRRRNRRHGTLYCSNCGSGLEPSVNYCPSCGHPNDRGDRGSTSRIRRRSPPRSHATVDGSRTAATGPNDRAALDRRIAAAVQAGWELEHDFGDHVVMVRRTVGGVNDHLLVALLTVWWTMGVGNVLYGAYRYFDDAERTVLYAAEADETETDDGSRQHGLWPAVGCWLAAALFAIGAATNPATGLTLTLGVLSVLLAVIGVGAVPPVRERLASRHAVTTNGWTRSVDERIVTAHDRPCAACADSVGRGIERIYRREFCVLGVPLSVSEGRNHYCRRCANAETAAVDPSGTATRSNESPDRSTTTATSEAGPTREREPERS
ncbi:zinc-ribbon domain-containing protein [Halopiger djelfimassiliensis]|uniref:zinc-ribbon domain-containing protein n=1 Tax=Halopiger djelfimassiliensis TaxID=1293047 RepID=UPI000677B8B6|nr:zinc-ribbon domain-containing protein [Halopiger djelfimassiliensis]